VVGAVGAAVLLRRGGDAPTREPAPAAAGSATDDVALRKYLDEADRLVKDGRPLAAERMLDNARALATKDHDLIIRLAVLTDSVAVDTQRAAARRALEAGDAAAAREAARKILALRPDDAAAAKILASTQVDAGAAP